VHETGVPFFVIFGERVQNFETHSYYPVAYLVLANSVALFLLSVKGLAFLICHGTRQ